MGHRQEVHTPIQIECTADVQPTHLCAEAVCHKVKGPIRWDEGDGAVVLETSQPYTPARMEEFVCARVSACVRAGGEGGMETENRSEEAERHG